MVMKQKAKAQRMKQTAVAKKGEWKEETLGSTMGAMDSTMSAMDSTMDSTMVKEDPKEVVGWATTAVMPLKVEEDEEEEEEEEEELMDDPFANAREAGGGDESAPPAEEEEEEEKKEEPAEDSVLAQCLLELEDIRMAEYALSRAEHMLLASTSIHNNGNDGNDDDGRLVRLRHAGLGKNSFSTSFVGTVD